MQDIRQGLRERLQAIEEKKAALEHDMEKLEETRKRIVALIDAEEQVFRDQPVTTTNAEFIREFLGDGQPHSLDELVENAVVHNLRFDDKSPRRVINFALMGMSRKGIVGKNADGTWQIGATNIPNQRAPKGIAPIATGSDLQGLTAVQAIVAVLRDSGRALKAGEIVERAARRGRSIPPNSCRGLLSNQDGRKLFVAVKRGLWTLKEKAEASRTEN